MERSNWFIWFAYIHSDKSYQSMIWLNINQIFAKYAYYGVFMLHWKMSHFLRNWYISLSLYPSLSLLSVSFSQPLLSLSPCQSSGEPFSPLYLHKQSPTQFLWQKQLNLSCFVSTWFLLSPGYMPAPGQWSQENGSRLLECASMKPIITCWLRSPWQIWKNWAYSIWHRRTPF